MRVGRLRFQIAEHLFLGQQLPGCACIVGQEHRRRGLHIAGEPFQHGTDLRLSLHREGNTPLQPLGGDPHQPFLDDVAGMFEIGGEG